MTVSILKILGSLLVIMYCLAVPAKKLPARELAMIAYYSGNATEIDNYPLEKLTHIIYSFAWLNGNKIFITGQGATVIKKLVRLKNNYPNLKILIALGGWGGCKNCSPVFDSEQGRNGFAVSVKEMLNRYDLDGIDLDWEYPAIQGPVGHPFAPADKQNFTLLIQTLRNTLGAEKQITFAAGAFTEYLQRSVEWKKVMPLVNTVHLMTYDLVNRNSLITGHHAALYSTAVQKESADNAIQYLDSLGIPHNKITTGIAFYARVFGQVDSTDHGLYQSCKFERFVQYKYFNQVFTPTNGYAVFRDHEAKAPFAYNAQKKLFATFDDARSVREKTRYAINKGLYGVMFWELRQDDSKHTLLSEIYTVKKQFTNQPAD